MSTDLTPKELEAFRYIKNRLIYRGEAPSVRELAKALGYRSPRSAALILVKLDLRGAISRREDGTLRILKDITSKFGAYTVSIPLVGSAPCGAPLLAEENLEGFVPISVDLAKPPYKYFLLRAEGDSMDQAGIKNGDLVLVRQQETASTGDKVVALIDDQATIKEFHPSKEIISLRPRSKNKKHQPIILKKDFRIQGIVVATVPKESIS